MNNKNENNNKTITIMRGRLRNLMVLFTMVFLPNLAWADYTCGGQSLTFYYTGDSGPNYYYSGSGDNQVTEWNVTADAFYQSSSSLYSGFSYVKLTNVNPLSGPLTGFTLAGSINNNNPQASYNNNVNLKVYRLATLSATERTLIGSITIGGSDVPSYTYIAEDGVSQSFNNEYIQLAIERSSSETTPTFTTGQITNITLTFSGTDYGISVGNYRVTSNNATDIFGDGNASFTAASGDTPATLTLNDVTIGTSTVNSSIISNLEDEQLTINLVGTNNLFGFINDVSNLGTLAFTGTGSLAITCQNGDAVVRNFNNVTLDDGLYIQTNTPGTHWENYYYFRGEADLVSEMTITPSVYYPIWVLSLDAVSYVQVSEANKSNVLGDVNATVKYNSTDEQLILNGFACTTTGGATAIVLGDQEEFKIYLSGDNTISSGGTGNGVCFNREVAFLTVSTDANNPGKLTLVQPNDGNYSLASVPYDCVIYENGLGFYNNTVSTVWPRLVIGNTQIMGTTDNVLDDENISFDAGTNTLTLSGATIENATNEPDIDVYVKDLIVAISEANTVNGRFYGHYTLNGSKVGTIHFTKVEGGNTPPSITISGDTDDSGPVYEFSQCTWDNDLYLTEAKTAGDANVPGVYYGSGRFTNGNTTPKTVKISTVPSGVMLWIGETAVTSANADNVFSGDNVLDGKVSVTFGDENKLILDASETPITEALSEMPIVSALPNLTISFKGSSSLNRIVSTNSAATLTFELAEGADESETENSCSLSSSGEMPWQGFSGNPVFNDKLVYLPNDDSRIIQKLMPPSFSMEGDELHFSGLSDSWGTNSFDCYYSIDYVEGDDVETTEYDSENPETIETACKVTAHVEFTDVFGKTTVSDNAIGKYFEVADKTIVFNNTTKGSELKASDLELSPATESEGVSFKFSGVDNPDVIKPSYTEGNGYNYSIAGIGRCEVAMEIIVNNPTIQVLNPVQIEVRYAEGVVTVVPDKPEITITKKDTERDYYLNTDEIAITRTSIDGEVADNIKIFYTWGDAIVGSDYIHNADNPILSIYDDTEPILAQTGALRAWVGYHLGDNEYLMSEVASQTFTVKTDISDYTVQGLVTPTTYTGAAIVPEFSVKATTTATTSLTANTDYTVSYKKVGEGEALTDVTSMVDAGSYKIIITGAGNYGGSISKDFEIARASVDWTATGWTSPQAKADLTFTNEAKDLITAATVPDGVTVKYCYKYSTSEFNEEALSALPDPVNWTTTVPQGTNAGYYAVFYKVEESANYEGWGPCEVALQISIAPKVTTFTVELVNPDEAITYDGTAKTPAIIVKDGNTELTATTDYTITGYLNNINAATSNAVTPPTVNIAGAGNYNGSTGSATFTINKAQLTVTPDNKTYNVGEAITLTVQYSGFVNGEDENALLKTPIASYGDADVTKAGIYTITVSGGEAQNYDFVYGTGTLTINRELGIGFADNQTWATYYATENLTVPEGLKAYIVTDVDKVNGTVTTSQVTYLPMNQAVLLEKTGTSSSGFVAAPYTSATTTITNNLLMGSDEAVGVSSINGGTVYVLYYNVFKRATGGTIPARHAYLVVSDAAPARLNIVHGGDDTGIDNIRMDEPNDSWYTIDGRKLNGQPQRAGFYIRNGKKVYKR